MKQLLFFLCLSLFFVQGFSQSADMVLLNGKVITLKSEGDVAEAVAIKGDKILAAGSNASIKKLISTKTKVIDLHGKTVTPGFNDVHQHPFPIYSWEKPYASLELDTVSSMASLINLIKRKASVTPKGMLIRGVGYNEVNLGAQPIRDSLDKATTDHPVLISHASGHLSAANSLMLQLNGIDQNTKDPPGGAFERYSNGIPDGIIKESAGELLGSDKVIHAPSPTFQEQLEGYQIYFHNMLAAGLTSIGDCWTTPDKVKIYEALAAEHFPLRFNLYIGVDYLDQLLDGRIQRREGDYLRIEGVKIFHGNSLSGKTCWLYEPYDTINPVTGKKDYYGIPPARSQASLDSLVLKIHKAGLQIACHSNGDREIDMVILAIERAQKAYYRPDARHRIEHCSITNQNILDKIKRDSIIPVFHCYSNQLGKQLLAYGPERLAMIMPTKTAIEMGIPFALHSDYPVSRYEAMIRLDGAVNRSTPDGIVIGANQRISPEEAIKAYTAGGAYTSHEENKKGKIIPGQFADVIVLDKDPTTIDPKQIHTINVLMTIVGGKIAFRSKALSD
jgi:predicted amidohydrolase YtcJ